MLACLWLYLVCVYLIGVFVLSAVCAICRAVVRCCLFVFVFDWFPSMGLVLFVFVVFCVCLCWLVCLLVLVVVCCIGLRC